MKAVNPSVYLISRPSLNWDAIRAYLEAVSGESWLDRLDRSSLPAGEQLVEFMGRLCYRSWAPGLNPNVTKIREDSSQYLLNILRSGHGSVLEHANYSFIFHNVSRVFTHEVVRHRAGTAISQESLRFVRLTDLPFEHPEYVRENAELLRAADDLLASMENFQALTVKATGIDQPGVDFHTKKTVTSAARRYAPDGVATNLGWTANIRALRHVITVRTEASAEVEIRGVFDQVASIMVQELPALFSDFSRSEDGSWRPDNPKV